MGGASTLFCVGGAVSLLRAGAGGNLRVIELPS